MNKSELIEELAERTGNSPKLTDKTVRIFLGSSEFSILYASAINANNVRSHPADVSTT